MKNTMRYDFGTISERDMDMLFLNAISTDRGFLQLFLDKTNLPVSSPSVEEVYLSKADKDGESDITVIFKNGDFTYAILIEDKIDALAMPDQQLRYTIRGDKAVAKKEYDEYRDFIICPKRYYDTNEEAKKYSHFVSYEECVEYFEKSECLMADVWVQQIKQAITKSKKHSETVIDEGANRFFNKYIDYLELHYPYLTLRTERESNGWWAHYTTRYKNVYIYHKIPQGFVDLTFPRSAEKMDGLSNIARTLNEALANDIVIHGLKPIIALPTGKAGVLRMEVPKFDMKAIKFEDVDKKDMDRCFYALSVFSKLANMLASADDITKKHVNC